MRRPFGAYDPAGSFFTMSANSCSVNARIFVAGALRDDHVVVVAHRRVEVDQLAARGLHGLDGGLDSVGCLSWKRASRPYRRRRSSSLSSGADERRRLHRMVRDDSRQEIVTVAYGCGLG